MHVSLTGSACSVTHSCALRYWGNICFCTICALHGRARPEGILEVAFADPVKGVGTPTISYVDQQAKAGS